MIEDEPLKALRKLRDLRHEIAEKIVNGGVSADNVAAGYRDMSGQIKGIDMAIEILQECFVHWLPEREQLRQVKPRPVMDY